MNSIDKNLLLYKKTVLFLFSLIFPLALYCSTVSRIRPFVLLFNTAFKFRQFAAADEPLPMQEALAWEYLLTWKNTPARHCRYKLFECLKPIIYHLPLLRCNPCFCLKCCLAVLRSQTGGAVTFRIDKPTCFTYDFIFHSMLVFCSANCRHFLIFVNYLNVNFQAFTSSVEKILCWIDWGLNISWNKFWPDESLFYIA